MIPIDWLDFKNEDIDMKYGPICVMHGTIASLQNYNLKLQLDSQFKLKKRKKIGV